MKYLLFSLLIAGLSLSSGCGKPVTATFSAVGTAKSTDEHGHDHAEPTREHMMLTHAGKHHAWLTAHLSKDGNELDIYFETEEDQPKPVALPVAKFTAKAKRATEETEYELTFEPAPADERPKDEKAGTCSHFVAKAPWMKPDDVLTVTAMVDIDGKPRKPTWRQFVPSKYAHVHP